MRRAGAACAAGVVALVGGTAGAAEGGSGAETAPQEAVFQTVLMEFDTPWLLHPERHRAVPTKRHSGWEPVPAEAVRVTHTVLPQVPDPGSDRTKSVTCQALLTEGGAKVADCAGDWRRLTLAALREWRFEPPLVDDRRRLRVGIDYPPPSEGVSPVVRLPTSLVGDATLLPPEVKVGPDPLWLLRKPQPKMPDNPEPLARCIATITVGATAKGKAKAQAVAVEGCPQRYHEHVEKAALKTVFGIPSTAPPLPLQTKIAYTFKTTGG